MAENDVIKHVRVGELNINSSTIGQDIQQRFNTIDSNFQKILESEYLKGVKGDSVYTVNVILTNNETTAADDDYQDGTILYRTISSLIFTNDKGGLYTRTEKRTKHLLGSTVTLIYEKTENSFNSKPKLVSMAPFIYKDPDFDNNVVNAQDTSQSGLDISCIIYYDIEKGFQKMSSLPTIYYDEDRTRFGWKINGVDTGLEAQGPPGAQGPSGLGLIIAKYKVENESNVITHIYSDFKNTTKTISVNDLQSDLWISITDISSIPVIQSRLINDCLVFALQEITDTESSEELPVVEENEQSNDNEEHWIWGLLHIDNSSTEIKYKIKSGGSLRNMLGDSRDLYTMMKMNRYTFIPTYQPDNYWNVGSETGHILYDKSGDSSTQTLEIGVANPNADESQNNEVLRKGAGVLKSHYADNQFNKITIPSQDGNPIVIESTDIDFSTAGTIKGTIEKAEQLTKSMGGPSNPVYFSNGEPIACGKVNAATSADELTTNAGNESTPVYFKDGKPVACTEVAADNAKSLVNDNNQGVSVGSANNPVYFKDGEPVACGKVNASTTADKLTINAGGTNNPVYFKDGKPVACGKVNASTTADKLTVNAGSTSKPVYFKDGKPIECGKVDVATTADKLSTTTAGNIGNPVYFQNGKPVECTRMTLTADAANKLTVNAGGAGEPVYFNDGKPVACGKVNTATLADQAKKLTTAQKIGISIGSHKQELSFDGTKPINFAFNGVEESGLGWGTTQKAGMTPVDVAFSDTNVNRLSFMNPEDITVQYSTNGVNADANWVDYELDDKQKTSFVTTGFKHSLYMGNKLKGQKPSDALRVTIKATAGKMYFSLKKILTLVSTGGASNAQVKVEALKYKAAEGKWEDCGTYKLTGWSGWNGININRSFGAHTDTSTGHTEKIRLTYFFESNSKDWVDKTSFQVIGLAMYGETQWAHDVNQSGPLASTGHLYKYDINRNVTFPANVAIGDTLDAHDIDAYDISTNNIDANTVTPKTNSSSIGSADDRWLNAYIGTTNTDNLVSKSVDAKNAKIETAEISKAIIDEAILNKINLGKIIFQETLPNQNTVQVTQKDISCEVKNLTTTNFHSFNDIGDPKDGYNELPISVDYKLGEIKILTSQIPPTANKYIDISFPNIFIPIGITYINDFDMEWGKKRWADVRIGAAGGIRVKCQAEGCKDKAGNMISNTITIPDIWPTTYDVYNSYWRNEYISYNKISLNYNNLMLEKDTTTGKYKDITIKISLISKLRWNRTWKKNYYDADRTRVFQVCLPGIIISNSTTKNDTSESLAYDAPNPADQLKKIKNNTNNIKSIKCTYSIVGEAQNSIYITPKGIKILNGLSYLLITPPSDNTTAGGDNSGYIEIYQYNPQNPNDTTRKKKKNLWQLLS